MATPVTERCTLRVKYQLTASAISAETTSAMANEMIIAEVNASSTCAASVETCSIPACWR